MENGWIEKRRSIAFGADERRHRRLANRVLKESQVGRSRDLSEFGQLPASSRPRADHANLALAPGFWKFYRLTHGKVRTRAAPFLSGRRCSPMDVYFWAAVITIVSDLISIYDWLREGGKRRVWRRGKEQRRRR